MLRLSQLFSVAICCAFGLGTFASCGQGSETAAAERDFAEQAAFSNGPLEVWGQDAAPTLFGGSNNNSTFGIRGWLSQGVTANPDDPINRENSPVTFNDRANEYQMNQLYLIAERNVATDGCSWDIGGRVDVLYGTDYYFTTATGMETRSDGSQHWNGASGPRGAGPGAAPLYGLSLPQAYAEIYAPYLNGITLRAGHFYSPLGYERAASPENFFYSHSYARQYAIPMTLTGAMATVRLTPQTAVILGGTLGWNSWDSARDQWGVLGGFVWQSCDERTAASLVVHTGGDGPPNVNTPGFFAGPSTPDNVTVASLVLSQRVSDELRYVFQHDFGVEQDAELVGASLNAAKWYGISQYIMYDLNSCWSFAMRFEWFRDQDHARVLNVPIQGTVSGGNYYGLTAGINWTPHESLVIRPEIRYDWSDTESTALNIGGPYDFFSDDDQVTLAFDAILLF